MHAGGRGMQVADRQACGMQAACKQAGGRQGRQGAGKAGTYQVAYQTVGHLLSKRLREASRRSSERL